MMFGIHHESKLFEVILFSERIKNCQINYKNCQLMCSLPPPKFLCVNQLRVFALDSHWLDTDPPSDQVVTMVSCETSEARSSVCVLLSLPGMIPEYTIMVSSW